MPAGSKAKKSDVVKVIPLSRANNVSIMLTQFSNFKRGSNGIRRAVFTGKGLGIERLSLLLQVRLTEAGCAHLRELVPCTPMINLGHNMNMQLIQLVS